MGKLRVTVLRYMEALDFRILTGIEMGMRNHELVPAPLVTQLANVRSGGVHKKLMELCRHKVCCYERGKHYDGYRLTNLGYDYLALKVLSARNIVDGVGSQIGVGKESDIYVVTDPEGDMFCMKIHRLGRTSFRKIKEKRDYHGSRGKSPWLYLSRLSATKEFTFMTALHEHGFPVPKPVEFNRHIIIMELVDGFPLNQIREIGDASQLYSDLMNLIVRMANYGIIHSDFNEFNIMVSKEGKPIMIDFPQMVSTEHLNAQMYFDRDVRCVVEFFKRRFNYESELVPSFIKDITREGNLDKEVEASGFSKEIKQFDLEGRVDDLNVSDPEDCLENEDVESEEDQEGKPHTDISSLPTSSFEALALNSDEDRFGKSTKICPINIDVTSCEHEIPSNDLTGTCTVTGNADISHELTSVEDEMRPPSPTNSVISKCFSSKSRALSPSSRSSIISELALMRQQRKNGEGDDSTSLLDFAMEFRNERGRALSHVSGSTTASTIPQEEVKKRTLDDLKKSLNKQRASKKNLRVKGEANAANRMKKDNLQEIKESLGWDEY